MVGASSSKWLILGKASIVTEAIARIDPIYTVERAISGLVPNEGVAHRSARSFGVLAELEAWLRAIRAKLSANASVVGAIGYMLKR